MKIYYTEYENCPEATDISRSNSTLSSFLGLFGGIIGILCICEGGWNIPLGILILVGTGAIIRLLSISSKRQIADTMDPVKNALLKAGLYASKQYQFIYKKNVFSLDEYVLLKVFVDCIHNIVCVAGPNDTINTFSFDEFVRLAVTQGDDLIGELSVEKASPTKIKAINVKKVALTQSKEIPVVFTIDLTEPVDKPLSFIFNVDSKLSAKYFNELIDGLKELLENYYGIESTQRLNPKSQKVTNTVFTDIKNSKLTIKGKNTKNIPEQITQLKTLADEGVITKEDFEAKKKELLSRM